MNTFQVRLFATERGETVREVAVRCDQFLESLRGRPERNLVVVSHGVLLEKLLTRSSLVCPDEAMKRGRYDNCEV